MTISVNHTIEIEDGEELDVIVECEYSPLIRTITNRASEDCSPEEGGYEGIVRVLNAKTKEEIPEEVWLNKINEDDIRDLITSSLEE